MPTVEFTCENEYRDAIVAAMTVKGWILQVHSDENCRYIPDLSFSGNRTGGWIEVKYCKQMPETLNHIDHYTKGQELWLRGHGAVGTGYCYLLVGSPSEHILVRWDALKEARHLPLVALPFRLLGVTSTPTWQDMCTFLNRHITAR